MNADASARRFEGKVVLIVGAARGVGLATATEFARQGALLSLADVDPSIDDIPQQLADAGGTPDTILASRTDMTSEEQCAQLVAATVERFGRVDVLAVVAGVLQQAAKIADLPSAEWDRVLGVNVKGPFQLARAVIPQMREQRSGRIVNVASWFSYSGHAFFGGYCASKAGLRMLTQAIAEEEAENGITANCVSPGNVDTEMHRTALREEAANRGITTDEMKDIEWAKIPLEHACPPEDIANAIVFLASDEARYMTGASLDVNGGVLLR
jgi:NAD(P)-dependent dehydrogenase (short-subunit alcohol dehydrogenase family)